MRFLLFTYDYFQKHRIVCFASLIVLMVVLVLSALRLDFKEDITDFLPTDKNYQESMKIYQEIVAADKIVLMFSSADTSVHDKQKITDAVVRFGEALAERDTAGWIPSYEPRVDAGQITDIFEHVYTHLPYYLTADDYARVDSLWKDDLFIRQRMGWVKEQIASPVSALFEPMYVLDPLGLGEDLASMLKDFQPETKYNQYNGFIFTADNRNCLVSIKSPFGGSETNLNAQLISLLNEARQEIADDGVDVCFIGAPVIAVDNATQIKHDTTIAVIISAVLIMLLLLFTFHNLRSLLLIAITTAFGFLFALGCMGLFRSNISLIVVGIASIIIGIAVNYPLHYVCHLKEHDSRRTLNDLVAPLLIGNITTVGAFLTLIPLEAVAIRDLGLFSALMLVGTIIFVLIYLPQINIMKSSVRIDEDENRTSVFTRMVGLITESKLSIVVILSMSIIFGYFSLNMQFDTNMNHINFMTEEQKKGMADLASMRGESDGTIVYVTSTADTYDEASRGIESLHEVIKEEKERGNIINEKNPIRLLPSVAMQRERLKMWQEFWKEHDVNDVLRVAAEEGFTDEAFEEMTVMTKDDDYPMIEWEDNEILTSTVFMGFVGGNSIVAQLIVPEDKVTSVEEKISELGNGYAVVRAFDLTSLNGRIASTLSADFSYIGIACSIIVFVFLWLSFGRIELAIVAFLPMAFGWIWILGFMNLWGISFNIVNIILATFIFGQGDDYTIFITEGLIKDYRNGGKILISYQKSIILSALIMFVGIGSLIIAKHPAMHSLAEVTIIGMSVVVLMAWIVPPIAFNLFVKYDKSLREYLNK